MKVYFIGAGPGDVDLITVKGDKCLRSCNYVMYAGSLVNSEFTKNLPNSVKVYDTSKLDLEEQISIYQEAKGAGQDVARLQSGDLSIYGAIAEQMRALDNLEIEYQIIQGDQTRDKRECNVLSGVTIENYFDPLIESVESTIQNPENLIEEAADSKWIRGGTPTRQIVKDIDYLQRCSDSLENKAVVLNRKGYLQK